jgi:hypothetical protein
LARDRFQRQQRGITEVEPFLPHPDDVEINMHTGDVVIRPRDFSAVAASKKMKMVGGQ